MLHQQPAEQPDFRAVGQHLTVSPAADQADLRAVGQNPPVTLSLMHAAFWLAQTSLFFSFTATHLMVMDGEKRARVQPSNGVKQ
eukprot:125955-Pelagomonas_calceolata.AAC.1